MRRNTHADFLNANSKGKGSGGNGNGNGSGGGSDNGGGNGKGNGGGRPGYVLTSSSLLIFLCAFSLLLRVSRQET
jgi:hypothetical protein